MNNIRFQNTYIKQIKATESLKLLNNCSVISTEICLF